MAHYQQIPKITVVFLGFPSSANVSAGAGPARTVVTELPATDPRAPRAPVMLDIIAKLKREHFANDHSIDLSRASVYRGPPDFSQIRPSSPLGMLSNGDFLLVVCSSLPKNLQTPNSAGTISQAARIPTQPPPRIQTRSLDTEPQYMDAISPWDQTPQHVRYASSPPHQAYPSPVEYNLHPLPSDPRYPETYDQVHTRSFSASPHYNGAPTEVADRGLWNWFSKPVTPKPQQQQPRPQSAGPTHGPMHNVAHSPAYNHAQSAVHYSAQSPPKHNFGPVESDYEYAHVPTVNVSLAQHGGHSRNQSVKRDDSPHRASAASPKASSPQHDASDKKHTYHVYHHHIYEDGKKPEDGGKKDVKKGSFEFEGGHGRPGSAPVKKGSYEEFAAKDDHGHGKSKKDNAKWDDHSTKPSKDHGGKWDDHDAKRNKDGGKRDDYGSKPSSPSKWDDQGSSYKAGSPSKGNDGDGWGKKAERPGSYAKKPAYDDDSDDDYGRNKGKSAAKTASRFSDDEDRPKGGKGGDSKKSHGGFDDHGGGKKYDDKKKDDFGGGKSHGGDSKKGGGYDDKRKDDFYGGDSKKGHGGFDDYGGGKKHDDKKKEDHFGKPSGKDDFGGGKGGKGHGGFDDFGGGKKHDDKKKDDFFGKPSGKDDFGGGGKKQDDKKKDDFYGKPTGKDDFGGGKGGKGNGGFDDYGSGKKHEDKKKDDPFAKPSGKDAGKAKEDPFGKPKAAAGKAASPSKPAAFKAKKGTRALGSNDLGSESEFSEAEVSDHSDADSHHGDGHEEGHRGMRKARHSDDGSDDGRRSEGRHRLAGQKNGKHASIDDAEFGFGGGGGGGGGGKHNSKRDDFGKKGGSSPSKKNFDSDGSDDDRRSHSKHGGKHDAPPSDKKKAKSNYSDDEDDRRPQSKHGGKHDATPTDKKKGKSSYSDDEDDRRPQSHSGKHGGSPDKGKPPKHAQSDSDDDRGRHNDRTRTPPRASSASPSRKSTRPPARRAVLIGINYKNTPQELKGCIEDVKGVHQMLTQTLGFEDTPETMRVLTDDVKDAKKMPTKKNILEAITWLRKDAAPGDRLYLHFSGHGSQQDSTDSYENLDETLVPCDFKQAGMIVDNELNEKLVFGLPKGVRMTCVFDCCHSGTILDLPFQYSAEGKLLGPPNLTDKHKSLKDRASQAEVILLSGCKDSQTAADAKFNNVAKGALTHALLQLLKKNPGKNLSFLEILRNVRDEMKKNKFTQIPQLSTSHEINPDKTLFL